MAPEAATTEGTGPQQSSAPISASVAPTVTTRSSGTVYWIATQLVPRLLVAFVFINAAWGKIAGPQQFAKEIRAYQMVPLVVSHHMAIVLPWLEMIVGVSLVIGLLRRESRALLLAMLVVFTIAKSVVLVQGLNINCGCVSEDSPIRFLFEGWSGVATNLVLIALLVMEGLASRSAARAKPKPTDS